MMIAPMTNKTEQRILVALNALEANEESLVMLATVAGRLKASLSGLYVEDSRLIEAAGLPFATQINRISVQESNLNRDSLARLNKRTSIKMQQLLETLSKQHKIAWSFNIEPGDLISKALSQKGFDVFFPARKRSGLNLNVSTLQQTNQLTFILLYDLSPQFNRALEMVRRLAIEDMVSNITILCENGLPKDITEQLLPINGVKLHIYSVASAQSEILISLKLNTSTLLMLSKQYIINLPEHELSELFNRIGSSMLLLD